MTFHAATTVFLTASTRDCFASLQKRRSFWHWHGDLLTGALCAFDGIFRQEKFCRLSQVQIAEVQIGLYGRQRATI
jgi:hypothetical protein